MTRLWLAALLAAALLGAWREALLHPLDHVDGHGNFVHLNGVDGSDARGENEHEGGDPSERLGDCLAALAACVPDAAALFSCREQLEHSARSTSQGAPRVAEAPPFLSQGPPFAHV
jgi:hypothetical protein